MELVAPYLFSMADTRPAFWGSLLYEGFRLEAEVYQRQVIEEYLAGVPNQFDLTNTHLNVEERMQE